MFSIGSVMTLKPGGYAGYKKAHDEIWPDLAEVISAAGVSMAIYKHGDLLFVHGVAPARKKPPYRWTRRLARRLCACDRSSWAR